MPRERVEATGELSVAATTEATEQGVQGEAEAREEREEVKLKETKVKDMPNKEPVRAPSFTSPSRRPTGSEISSRMTKYSSSPPGLSATCESW